MSALSSYLAGRRSQNFRYDSDPYLYGPPLPPAPARYEGHHHVTSPAHHTSMETAPPVNGNIDWKETETEHVFKVDLQGLRKEDVVVDLEDSRVVKVTWERWTEREDGTDPWRRIERTCSRFVRSIRLPEDSKPHLMKASMEGGVLTIRVPREEVWMNRRGPSTRIPIH